MKHFKQKVFALVLIAVLLLSSITAFANTTSPYWSYLILMTADMDVNDYNWATIDATCEADYWEVDSMTVTVELQQLDGSWETIESWTESVDDSIITLNAEAVIPKNYSYRLKVTAEAYNNGVLLETATEYFRYGYYS